MYYVDFYSLFNHPEKDWEIIMENANDPPPEPSLFDWGGLEFKKFGLNRIKSTIEPVNLLFSFFIGQQ